MQEYKDRIKASLTYGKVFAGKPKIILSVLLYILLFLDVVLLYAICSILRQVKNGTMQIDNIEISVIGIIILAILPLGVILWRICYNKKVMKKIDEWLKDAVLLNAIGRRLSYYPYSSIQVQVEFCYEGKRYKRVNTDGNALIGYYRPFKEDKKKLKILYSPKYDEVLILRD